MIDIEILKKQNNLTINDDGYIYIKPQDEINYSTFPLEDLDGCLALSLDEYLGLRVGYYRFNEDLNGLVINQEQSINDKISERRKSRSEEIIELEEQLDAN